MARRKPTLHTPQGAEQMTQATRRTAMQLIACLAMLALIALVGNYSGPAGLALGVAVMVGLIIYRALRLFRRKAKRKGSKST